eukprot:259177-Rhodomonas_salina.1
MRPELDAAEGLGYISTGNLMDQYRTAHRKPLGWYLRASALQFTAEYHRCDGRVRRSIAEQPTRCQYKI